MKKVSCFLVVLILVFSSAVGLAEEPFTLHSGVHFGMTHDEVYEAESKEGFIASEYELNEIRESYSFDVKGMIAGVNDASIRYYFGMNDSLHEAVYMLYSSGNSTDRRDVFFDTLSTKYGEPNADDKWVSSLESGAAMTDRVPTIMINSIFGSVIQETNDDVWLIEQNDGSYVSIDLLTIDKMDNGRESILNFIIYASFSKEDVENAIGQVIAAGQEVNDQLKNDL